MLITVIGLDCGPVEINVDLNELGHELCMGIRHGLCGSEASDGEDPFGNVADAIENMGSALDVIAEAVTRISRHE